MLSIIQCIPAISGCDYPGPDSLRLQLQRISVQQELWDVRTAPAAIHCRHPQRNSDHPCVRWPAGPKCSVLPSVRACIRMAPASNSWRIVTCSAIQLTDALTYISVVHLLRLSRSPYQTRKLASHANPNESLSGIAHLLLWLGDKRSQMHPDFLPKLVTTINLAKTVTPLICQTM